MQGVHSSTMVAKKWKRNFFLLTGFPLLLLLNGYAWFPTSYHLFFEFFLPVQGYAFIFCIMEFFIGLIFYSFYSPTMNEKEQKTTEEDSLLVFFFLLVPLCSLTILPVVLYNVIAML